MKANARLKRLYEERISGPGLMTQKEFGQRYGIGSQSMVAQYLNGDKSLNLEAAEKFARGLRCTIYDIDPEMGDWLTNKVYPLLGKALRRAAVIAGAALLVTLSTAFDIKPAAASNGIFSPLNSTVYTLGNFVRKTLRRWWVSILTPTFSSSLRAWTGEPHRNL